MDSRRFAVVEVAPCDRSPALVADLFAVWEASVRATHGFLPEGEVERIGAMVPDALAGVRTLLVCSADGEDAAPIAFLGLDGPFVEMLFVAPEARGRGVGRLLMERAVSSFGASEVSVNEQNPQAVGFYEHLGFRTYRRAETDAQGDPYPLLFMRLEGRSPSSSSL